MVKQEDIEIIGIPDMVKQEDISGKSRRLEITDP